MPDTNLSEAAVALDMDPLEGQVRQVFFFDTPELALNAGGVVARARRVQGRGDDSVVKLRPVVPGDLPKKVRRSPGFGVEVDAMPGGFVCSGTMKQRLEKPIVRKRLLGGGRISSLFTKEQRAFFSEHAPEGIELDELSILGPIFVLKARVTPKDLGRRLVGELWLYPDGSRIVELSTKCLPHGGLRRRRRSCAASCTRATWCRPRCSRRRRRRRSSSSRTGCAKTGPDQAAWRSCTWGVRRGSSVTVPPRTSQKASA